MSTSAPTSFSVSQRVLHWLMAALIVFNLIFTEGIEIWNRAVRNGGVATPEQISAANIHAYVGIAVLVFAVLRLALRLVRGAPEAPAVEPPIARLASKVAHGAFYLLFFALPLSGIGRYYFGVEAAGEVHGGPLKLLMWVLIVVHVAAVLVHQFYWKTDVPKRMTSGPAKVA